MEKKTPIVSIVGKSNSGKTTLIEKLVARFKQKGYRVGTIKHDAHTFEIDHEGKDSYRHFHAGADTVVICSSEKMAMNKRLRSPAGIDDIVEQLFRDVDLVITEGYMTADKPKVEIVRKGVSDAPLCSGKKDLIAVASDMKLSVPVPLFSLDDDRGIADFIESAVMAKPAGKRQQPPG